MQINPIGVAFNVLLGLAGYYFFGWFGALGFVAGFILLSAILLAALEAFDGSAFMMRRRIKQNRKRLAERALADTRKRKV